MAAIGEGESTLTELLSHLASGSGVEGISGLWTKTGGQIHRTPPGMLVGRLDTLPAPDWELFDSRHLDVNYFVKGKMLPMRLGFFETGRGCPSSCPYCINEHLHTLYRDVDKYERRKPVQSLIEEISEKVHRYKLQYVFLIDDWLALRSKRVQRFFDAYRDQIKLPFTFLTRPEEITEKATANAVSAGAAMVGIGIECGDEQLRRGLLRRRMSNKTIINAFTICRHLGLSTHSYNMIGLPFETRSSIQATISLNQKASPDFVGVSIFYPFPGTSLRALCEERGLLRAESDVVRKTFHSATAIKGPLGAGRLARLRVLIPHMVFCRSRLGRAWLSTCERSTLAFRVFSSLEQRKQGHLSMYGNGG